MKKFHHLYGLDSDPKSLHQMNYIEALWRKVKWAEERIVILEDVNWRWRPMSNIVDCLNAVKHNRALIFEYKEEL